MTEIIIIINSQVMGLRGGGGKKVIKTIVKSKSTEKTVDTDRSVYEKAFVNALELHRATNVNFKELLKGMSVQQLEELRDFILHHKSTNDRKILQLAEYLPVYKPMNLVAMKINAAMDHLKELLQENLCEQCGDQEGNIKMNLVIEAIKFRIEHTKESGNDMSE